MESILVVLKKKFKDWKEGNLNLNKDLFGLFQHILEENYKFSKKGYQQLVGLFIEKLGDAKFNDILQKMIEKICLTVLPKFVIN